MGDKGGVEIYECIDQSIVMSDDDEGTRDVSMICLFNL
jgi:hypothetical protein